MEAFVAREVQDKQLPALSIALVEDQHVVWAAGFGFRDPHAKLPATANTSNGPQKSRTSTSSKIKMATVRVGM